MFTRHLLKYKGLTKQESLKYGKTPINKAYTISEGHNYRWSKNERASLFNFLLFLNHDFSPGELVNQIPTLFPRK